MEGNLTAPEFVADMEEHATLSVGFREDTKGHAVPRTEAGLKRFGLFNRSCLNLKLLGISLVAHQLPTASAESICRAFNSLGKKFNLIGLISAVGASAAAKSLKYSALNDSHFYATGHIGPGSLNIAAALYEATEFPLARLLAFGGSPEDRNNPAKLGSTEGSMRYIGLKSNTECPLGNGVGESIVQNHKSLWPKSVEPVEKESQTKRPTTVIVLKAAEDRSNPVKLVSLKATKWSAFIFGWLPLALTIAVIVSCCFCKLWFVAALIFFGTLSMMIAVSGLRHFCHYKYSEPKLAEPVPEGDILVVDDKDPDVLTVVKGTEYTIQKLFQRKIVFEAIYGKYILFLAASMLYIYVLASVLYMSNVSTSGQIHFAIANLIGLVADMAKASQNEKLGLARKACKEFRIDLDGGGRRKPVVFMNRTMAMAAVATFAKDPSMLKSKKLLPSEGHTWEEWWKRLAEKLAPPEGAVDGEKESEELLHRICHDMDEGIFLNRESSILGDGNGEREICILKDLQAGFEPLTSP